VWALLLGAAVLLTVMSDAKARKPPRGALKHIFGKYCNVPKDCLKCLAEDEDTVPDCLDTFKDCEDDKATCMDAVLTCLEDSGCTPA